MRFQTQLHKLETCLPLLEVKTASINGSSSVSIVNIQKLSDGISLISDLEYLNPELANVIQLGVVQNVKSESIVLSKEIADQLYGLVKQLQRKVGQNIQILENTIVQTNELTVSIKLIEHNSLKELGDELQEIDKIVNQIISHKDISGSYKFSSFDVGTSWVNIIFNSSITMSLLAGVAWSACVIRKKWIEGNYLYESAKQMKVKTEALADIKRANEELVKELVEGEAINLMNEFKLDNTDNEYKNRLIWGIEALSRLINDGVQVQPSLMVPEDKQNLFPDYNALDVIESKTKLLEKKES